MERSQQPVAQRIPETQFSRGTAVEERSDIDTVRAFGGCSEPQQFLRFEAIQQRAVGSRLSMVEFVDDDDPEGAWREVGNPL